MSFQPRLLLLTFSLFSLLACAPNYYGYDKTTWDTLPEPHKQKIIAQFKQMQEDNQIIRNEMDESLELMYRTGKYER